MRNFVKSMTPSRAVDEVAGWRAVREHLAVPRLISQQQFDGCRAAVEFEDVFASGRCAYLLGDAIGLADRGLTDAAAAASMVSEACADLVHAAERTGRPALLDECVPALYLNRLRPGGRLDRWYGPDRYMESGGAMLSIADLANFDLITNERRWRADLTKIIDAARRGLSGGTRWFSAITQGDPTEPNIAWPLTWLDFEHAGRNTLVGEVANLLWYLLGMGGWLVPTYQPDVYARTLRYNLSPVATPSAEHLAISARHRRIEVTPRWSVGCGRAAALSALQTALRGDLGRICAVGRPGLMDALRPFLVCRVLGVINLCTLRGGDAAICLAMLARLAEPGLLLDDLLSGLSIIAPPAVPVTQEAIPCRSAQEGHPWSSVSVPS